MPNRPPISIQEVPDLAQSDHGVSDGGFEVGGKGSTLDWPPY
jgi:hypothetical protein